MIIKLTSGELKMVVILTTALALGIGAVAACVVPWFYCKPKNDGDDELEPTAIEDASGSVSRSRSIDEENFSSTMRFCIYRLCGGTLVRVVIPHECGTSNVSELSSTGENSTGEFTLSASCRENSGVEQRSLPVQTSKLNSNNAASGISDASRKKDGRSSERAFIGLESSTSRSINPRNLNPRSINSGPSHSVPILSRASNSGLLLVIKENPSPKGSVPDASILTSIDESSAKMTRETLRSEKSELTSVISRENTILTTEAPSESSNRTNVSAEPSNRTNVSAESSNHTNVSAESTTNALTSHESRDTSAISKENEVNIRTTLAPSESSNQTDGSIELTNSTSSSQESKGTSATSRKSAVNTSATAALSDSSNTGKFSTGTRQQTSTSQESDDSYNPPAVSASVETRRVAEFMQTINEISVDPATSREGLPQKSSTKNLSKSNEKGNNKIDENLCTPVKAANSNLKKSPPNAVTPMVNSSFDKNSDSIKSAPCDDERGKKSSRRSRYTMALADGLKKVWRSVKFDRTPHTTSGVDRQQSGIESIQSLSAGAKIPTGHSTLNEPTKLMISGQNSFQYFGDPRIEKIIDSETTDDSHRLRIQINEEPLDLSTRLSCDVHKNDEKPSSSPQKNYGCTGGFGKVFREGADFLRIKRGSLSSEEGATRSGSIEFHSGALESCAIDENENLTSNDLNVNVNLKMENTPRFVENQEGNRLDASMNVKEKKISQKIKNMFKLHNKIGERLLSSGKRDKNLGNVPVEFQRDSTETRLRGRNDRDSRVSRSSESPDISSYLDLGFSISGDEGNEPCTEL